MSHFFSDTWVAERTGRHRTTIKRWRDAGRFPPELERLAELELEGRVELINGKWDGWTLDSRTGELVSPGGCRYLPAELLAMPIRYQQLAELERAIARQAPATWLDRIGRLFSRREPA